MKKKSGYFINCENCNKEIYQTKTQYERAIHHFCSVKCQKEFEHCEKFEDRKCEVCEKIMHVSKISTKKFCSTSCQKKWQTTLIQEKNSKYSRIECDCTQCGEPLKITKSNFERFKNHFCNKDCRRQWYSDIYSQSEEWKEESRIRATELLKTNVATTKTSPQLKINNLLDLLNIEYINEMSFKYYSVDNYLKDYNLIIEVMGDYWHCNPNVFSVIKQDVQRKRIPKDKAKHTYIKNNQEIEILYLWESEINKNIKLCKKLIEMYITNGGILENYHSFNYSLFNDNIKLNDDIILPYQDFKTI